MSEPEGHPANEASQPPVDATDVVVQVTDMLRDYLSTDSSFAPEMAVERVRVAINSKAGMAAFVSDALRPSEVGAEMVVVKLAEALDQHRPPREAVLQLIETIEGPLAVEVYDRAMERRHTRRDDPED